MLKGKYIRNRRFLWIPVALVFLTCFLAGCVATDQARKPAKDASPPPTIEAIEERSDQHQTRIEIVPSGPARFSSFQVPDPGRVVLDIHAVPAADLPGELTINKGPVKNIAVQGAEAPPTRIVFYLAGKADYQILEKKGKISLVFKAPPDEENAGEMPAATEKSAAAATATTSPEEESAKEPRIFFKPRANSLNQILGVDFTMLAQGRSRLTVTAEEKFVYDLQRRGPKSLVLSMQKVHIPDLLLRRLDSTHFQGVVDLVKAQYSEDGNKLDLIIFMRQMVPFHLEQEAGAIRLDFEPTSIEPKQTELPPVRKAGAQRTARLPEAEPGASTQQAPATGQALATQESIPGLGKRRYTGQRMTLDFVDTTVTNVLRAINDITKLNIIWGPDVKGTVSMRLENVPWDQALDLVLANNRLAMRRQGNVIWVTTRKHIDELKKAERAKREEAEKAKELVPLETVYLPVDFATAEDIKQHIVVGKRGSVSVDARTNTIILKDVPSNIANARKIVERFDTPVKQIMIEARIVDASTNFSRDLGVQWNSLSRQWRRRTSQDFNESDPANFTTPGDLLTGGSFSTNAPEGWAGNLGFTFARLTNQGLGTVALDATLSLAETEGKVKIISAPKVIASNGEEALISRGDVIYRDVVTADTRDTEKIEATLSLKVTPTVSFNNYVTMDIAVTDDKALSATRELEKRIETKLMVKSGETLVIGGIFKEDETNSEQGVPWLKDTPLVGWLFKARQKTTERTELLIFLTPRVIQTAPQKI